MAGTPTERTVRLPAIAQTDRSGNHRSCKDDPSFGPRARTSRPTTGASARTASYSGRREAGSDCTYANMLIVGLQSRNVPLGKPRFP